MFLEKPGHARAFLRLECVGDSGEHFDSRLWIGGDI